MTACAISGGVASSRGSDLRMQPRQFAFLEHCLDFLLIFVSVHRPKESGMTVARQVITGQQVRQNIAFQAIAFPVLEDAAVHHEEARVDPVIMQNRLLAEAGYPAPCIRSNGAILRAQWNTSDGAQPTALAVEIEQ